MTVPVAGFAGAAELSTPVSEPATAILPSVEIASPRPVADPAAPKVRVYISLPAESYFSRATSCVPLMSCPALLLVMSAST